MSKQLQTRRLRTRLSEILSAELVDSVEKTAQSIGIAPNTYRKLLRDNWSQVARTTIEKICDRFDLDISEVFELVSDDFWRWFRESNEYFVLRTARFRNDVSSTIYEPRDANATAKITNFLKDSFPSIVSQEKAIGVDDESEVIEYVRAHNCVVVGGLLTNPITEIVICRHFGAVPFDSTQENRRKLPARFV
jgi:DNA-binding Xre family transcriptional regulator